MSVGGKCSRRNRPCLDYPVDATEVHLYKNHSVAPVLAFKKSLRAVECLLGAIDRDGFSLCRGLELHKQWSCILEDGPIGNLDWDSLDSAPCAGIVGFRAEVGAAIDAVTKFVQHVVASRREAAIHGWRNWILEDP